MGGKSSQTQQQQSQTGPWAPTQVPLGNLINQISNQPALPTYAPQAQALASNLLSNQPNYNQAAQGYLNAYQGQLNPFVQSNYLDPMSNPYLAPAMNTLNQDITNQINDEFAGAGRDLSGLNTQALARGLSQGEANLLMNQYNTNVGNYMNAANSLYGAGNATNQTILGNAQTGLGVGQSVPGLANNNIAAQEQLLLPIAGLGSQSSGSATGTYTMSPAQTAAMWGNAFGNTFGGQYPASGNFLNFLGKV